MGRKAFLFGRKGGVLEEEGEKSQEVLPINAFQEGSLFTTRPDIQHFKQMFIYVRTLKDFLYFGYTNGLLCIYPCFN